MSSVLFVFVDGLGYGPADPEINPVARADLPNLTALAGQPLAGDRAAAPDGQRSGLALLDATLGVPGLPQSATGQATLLTGRNIAQAVGRHVGPYPGRLVGPHIARGTLWHAVRAAGRPAALANAYPDRYLERAARGTGRMGAFARSAHGAGVRLRGPADLIAGAALSAFITNRGWREHLGYEGVPDIDAVAAGEALGRLAGRHDLTVFELYALDIAGHRFDWPLAMQSLAELDAMVGAARAAQGSDDVLVIAADHGNVEDMSTNRHTLAPALGLWAGPPAAPPLRSLTDVAPAVLAHLGLPPVG